MWLRIAALMLCCAFMSRPALAAQKKQDPKASVKAKAKTPAPKKVPPPSLVTLESKINTFLQDKNARRYRDRYDDLIKQLSLYTARPENKRSLLRAYFLIARLSDEVASITSKEVDKKAAIKNYEALQSQSKRLKLSTNEVAQAERNLQRLKGVAPPQGSSTVFLDSIEENGNAVMRVFSRDKVRISPGEIKLQEGMPRRVYIDVTPAKVEQVGVLLMPAMPTGVQKVRAGQFNDNTVRYVVELDPKAQYRMQVDSEGHFAKMIFSGGLQVQPVDDSAVLPKLPAEIRSVDAAVESVMANRTLSANSSVWRIRRIVIDPGHGGDDPGAIGRSGAREKDLTLAIGKQVREMILREFPDVKVYMTRETDKTVALKERTEMANNLEADLFISIHVNAHANRAVEGIETYYLNISHDRYAIRLAARENAVNESAITDLEFILADLAMKSNVQDSIKLGQTVQSSVVSGVTQKWSDVKDLGLKHALFYVLLGARMPSILIETAFISNRKDEKRLVSRDYQQEVSGGIVRGIRRFVEERQAAYVR